MIRVAGLTKSYPGSPRPLFSNVEFSVDRGAVLWVSGPSGSGKTSLLNVLGLLTGADSGRYTLDGKEMLHAGYALRVRARRDLVSTVFQRGNLFAHLSAMDNVLVGMHRGDLSVARTHLAAVGMSNKAHQLAGLLSGGEQGRVAIARAAARCTPVLLADEPVAGLDDANAEGILTLLAAAGRSGVAVVVVSHDMRTRQIATAHLTLGPRQTC